MEIVIAAVGKARAGSAEAELTNAYLRRLPWPARVVEVEDRRSRSPGERVRREGEKLLAALPRTAHLVCLDAQGEQMTSEGFAEALGGWQEAAAQVAFAIGGADGHSEAVRARAAVTLSLSRMTWPHLMVRAMLAEQLYRAFAIRTGHPYHRA